MNFLSKLLDDYVLCAVDRVYIFPYQSVVFDTNP